MSFNQLAQGQDGKGKLPDDFWPTYSAMANTRGGYVVLSVREKNGNVTLAEIEDVETVRKQLFDIAGDTAKVNANVLTNESVQVVTLDGKQLLVIAIPAAHREHKPVYLTSRDDKILKGFNFADSDLDSLKASKNLFAAAKAQHPWLELELFELFKKIGGWRLDRQSGEEGITLASVLMSGTWDAIEEAAPNYFVDYREQDEANTERWVDRRHPYGSWSGNVFDFYRRTYRKLVTDLKVPFELQDGIRLDIRKKVMIAITSLMVIRPER